MDYVDKEIAYIIESTPDPINIGTPLYEQVEVDSSYIGFSEEEKADIRSRYPEDTVYFEWGKEYNP